MDKIYQKIQQKTQNWNVDAIVEAVIKDDPEMHIYADDLRDTLEQVKRGHYANWRTTQVPVSPIAEMRNRANLSQPKFAEKLGISVNTLRSWEQGLRKPSGAAKTLLDLLYRRPDLLNEICT